MLKLFKCINTINNYVINTNDFPWSNLEVYFSFTTSKHYAAYPGNNGH